MQYTEQQFKLDNLNGLSAKQIDIHLKLYAGYVKNVNAIMGKIAELKTDAETHALALSELKRRFGFEFNGMRLHELYFESLGGDGQAAGGLVDALTEQWGTFNNWLNEFKAMGAMRGIGWVLLTYDPKAQAFHNVWVSDHELGHLAALPIILALDMWEHAFMVDYMPAQKSDYVATFIKNLDWKTLETRFVATKTP